MHNALIEMETKTYVNIFLRWVRQFDGYMWDFCAYAISTKISGTGPYVKLTLRMLSFNLVQDPHNSIAYAAF